MSTQLSTQLISEYCRSIWSQVESGGVKWSQVESWSHGVSCFPLGFGGTRTRRVSTRTRTRTRKSQYSPSAGEINLSSDPKERRPQRLFKLQNNLSHKPHGKDSTYGATQQAQTILRSIFGRRTSWI